MSSSLSSNQTKATPRTRAMMIPMKLTEIFLPSLFSSLTSFASFFSLFTLPSGGNFIKEKFSFQKTQDTLKLIRDIIRRVGKTFCKYAVFKRVLSRKDVYWKKVAEPSLHVKNRFQSSLSVSCISHLNVKKNYFSQ